jgi:hypothetical protein
MNPNQQENSKSYGIWLITMGLAGGLSGWIIQGMTESFRLWTLPLFCLGAIAFTLNGDNLIESIVLLVIVGGLLLFLSDNLGVENILSVYVTLFVAKIGFALAKEGTLGNKEFS